MREKRTDGWKGERQRTERQKLTLYILVKT